MKPFELKKVPVALQYLRYKLVSSTAHDLHSPFVFDFYNNVIRDETPFYSYRAIESVRAKMLLSNAKINVLDLGTGGIKKRNRELPVSFIAKQYVKQAKDGQLLFRLVNRFRPANILEIGTSLGITTMYLASPDSNANVITLEGCPETASAAGKNFITAGVKNIQQITGEFSITLPDALKKMPHSDFVFFDGNHRKDATLNYFHQCLLKHDEQSVFVFDDIHWSRDMREAWKTIQQHEAVMLTIDLFNIGIVFFRKGLLKQHFMLKY